MLEETFSFEQSEIAKALALLQALLKSLPFVHIVRHQLFRSEYRQYTGWLHVAKASIFLNPVSEYSD